MARLFRDNHHFLQSLKIIFLHVDVKERAFPKAWGEKRRSRAGMVGLIGLEPMTPALSRRCSNQLSYRPRRVPGV